MPELVQQRAQRVAETTFLGGPTDDFERVGLLGFEVLLHEGLTPSSRVLDVGCGALRLGCWLLPFLERGHYYGIEPAREMLRVGVEQIVGADVIGRADPHFDFNDEFDFGVFGEKFDFVIARSVWTHASKSQIRSMLESFALTSTPRGVFLASYHPASVLFRIAKRWPDVARFVQRLPVDSVSPLVAGLPPVGVRVFEHVRLHGGPALAEEYRGDGWAGRSHESDEKGRVRHSLHWIAAEASRHGLVAQLMPYPVVNHQYWLRIKHADRSPTTVER